MSKHGLREIGETKFSKYEKIIIEMYKDNVPAKDISAQLGCSVSTVMHYCKKNGVKPTARHKRKVAQLSSNGEVIAVYDSQTEAAKSIDPLKFKALSNNISECCLGKRKTARGYKWEYN